MSKLQLLLILTAPLFPIICLLPCVILHFRYKRKFNEVIEDLMEAPQEEFKVSNVRKEIFVCKACDGYGKFGSKASAQVCKFCEGLGAVDVAVEKSPLKNDRLLHI